MLQIFQSTFHQLMNLREIVVKRSPEGYTTKSLKHNFWLYLIRFVQVTDVQICRKCANFRNNSC
ncbi:MAG: hypothetical protein DSY90_09470 [Deltaproteobacteria bacterium]|nr:MAG: hypothetical protein DSY90_09470 [Deltaproteobacteria bacterium]